MTAIIGREPNITRNEIIQVKDRPGSNITAKINNAIEHLRVHRGASVIQLPDYNFAINDEILLADPLQFTNHLDLYANVTIRGGRNCQIRWDPANTVASYAGKTMFKIPAAYGFRMEQVELWARFPDGTPVPETTGIDYYPGHLWESRIARSVVFSQVRTNEFEYGFHVGAPEGADFTNTQFQACGAYNYDICGFLFEGPNLAGMSMYDTNIGSNREVKAGVWLKSDQNFYFDGGVTTPEYKDYRGNSIPLNWTDATHAGGSSSWNFNIIDGSGVKRGQPGFVEAEARTLGGGPDINFYGITCAHNYSGDNIMRPLIHVDHEAWCKCYYPRLEGSKTGLLRTEPRFGNKVFNRGSLHFVDVESASVVIVDPIDLGGNGTTVGENKITLDTGHFPTGVLPEEGVNENQAIIYRGLITSDTDILHAEGKLTTNLLFHFPFSDATGSSTAEDISSAGVDATLTTADFAAGRFNNSLDLDGTGYAETATRTDLNGSLSRPHGQIRTLIGSLKINGTGTTEKDFAAVVSHRKSGNNGWVVRLNSGTGLQLTNDVTSYHMTGENLKEGVWYTFGFRILPDEVLEWWLNGRLMNTDTTFLGLEYGSVSGGVYTSGGADGHQLSFGIEGSLTARKFHGQLENFRAWDQPLNKDLMIALTSL